MSAAKKARPAGAKGIDTFWSRLVDAIEGTSEVGGGPVMSPNPNVQPILENAAKDPAYRPYCLRCAGLVRMEKVVLVPASGPVDLYWRCGCGARCDLRKAVVEVVVRVDGVEVQKLEQHVDRWAVPHVVQAAIVQVEDPDYDGARDAGLAPGVRT